MKLADDYRKAYPNKIDDQIIEQLGNEVKDKVETIHALLRIIKDQEHVISDLSHINKLDYNKISLQSKRIKILKSALTSMTDPSNRQHMISIASDALLKIKE